MKRALGGLVYSTEFGRICPGCGKPQSSCLCKAAIAAPKGDGIVRVSRETKGRGGKCVTVIKGMDLDPPALADAAKRLKAACGSGGTAKDGVIEIQGDHADQVLTLLKQQGHTVKRAGG